MSGFNRSHFRLLIAAAVMPAAVLVAPAQAQDRTLEDCRAIENDLDRLSCYDSVTRAPAPAADDEMAEAEEDDPVAEFGAEKVPPAPAPVAEADPQGDETEERRGLLARFGAEKIPFRNNDDEEEELQAITQTIVDYRVQPYGELLVQLENGQIWRQLEPRRSITRLIDDETVKTAVIERAALGSYNMKVLPMDRVMKVRRLK